MNEKEKIIIESDSHELAKAYSILLAIISITILSIIAFCFYLSYYYEFVALLLEAIGLPVFVIIAIIYYYIYKKSKITVTNKRVYGSVVFGQKIDLPLDSVSAIGVNKLLKGISVSTSSGRISFLYIKQYQEVYNAISGLLMERQDKTIKPESKSSDGIEQLKQYKELLDMGAITQEEFEAKKKELLNI